MGFFLHDSDVQPAITIVESKIFALATEIQQTVMSDNTLTLQTRLVQGLSATNNVTTVVDTLMLIRTELRKDKLYDLADLIRLKLTDAGIKLEDGR